VLPISLLAAALFPAFLIGLVLVPLVGGLALISIYNNLVALRVRCDGAWSDIDVQLKRRHDLIPNIVEAVKGYAGYEKGTLAAVIEARNKAQQATGTAAQAQAENQLGLSLKGLLALAESYPQLRANEQFTHLQQALSGIEDSLQSARRYYNAVVRDLNTAVASFPSNLVASSGGVRPRDFFELSDPAERAVPSAKMDLT